MTVAYPEFPGCDSGIDPADPVLLDFWFLPGRAGGQVGNGGTGVDEEAVFRGTSDASLGLIRFQSPLIFDDVTAANSLQPYSVADTSTQAFTALFVGGTFNASPTITFSNGVFIYEGMRVAPNIQSLVAPTFAAFTLLQALPLLRSGPVAGQSPLSVSVLNAGPSVQNEFATTQTTPGMSCLNWVGTIRTTLAGATLNVTNFTGLNNAPKFATVAGSAISFGTIRALWAQVPAVQLFSPGAGTESMTAYYAVDVDNLGAFGGAAPVAAVRSAITDGTTQFFLLNTGGARSDWGASDHFDVGSMFFAGDGVARATYWGASDDAGIYFDGTDLILDPRIGGGFGRVQVLASGITVTGDIFPVSDFIREASSTFLILSAWRLTGRTSGDMTDGFGTAMFWSIEDDTSGRVNIAFTSAERAGADNTGLVRQWVYLAGSAIEAINYTGTLINLLQDTVIGAGKDLDCATNGAFFKPRRLSQSGQPTPDSGELLVWRDSDDSRTYLVFQDPTEGTRQVEMI